MEKTKETKKNCVLIVTSQADHECMTDDRKKGNRSTSGEKVRNREPKERRKSLEFGDVISP